MKEILLKQINQFLSLEGNEVGGNLHIVLDDGNLEDNDIAFCLVRCAINNDFLGYTICANLLHISYEEREEIYDKI